jgi:hypothetical protein
MSRAPSLKKRRIQAVAGRFAYEIELPAIPVVVIYFRGINFIEPGSRCHTDGACCELMHLSFAERGTEDTTSLFVGLTAITSYLLL